MLVLQLVMDNIKQTDCSSAALYLLFQSNGYSHEPRRRINSIDNVTSSKSARKSPNSQQSRNSYAAGGSQTTGNVTPRSQAKRDNNLQSSAASPLSARGIR